MNIKIQKVAFCVGALVLTACGNASPQSSTSPTAAPSQSPIAPTKVAANIYFVSDTGTSLRLYSEQIQVNTANSTESALEYILSGTAPKDPDYSNLWPAGSKLNSLTISGDLATIDVTFDKLNVGAEAEARALDQLVRTAVAANSEISTVQFLRDGKVVESFAGHLDTTQPIAVDEGYESLATVDIDLDEGIVLTSPVTFTGTACTFEANVPWELSQDGKVIDSGSVTASQACPVRSPWTVDLSELASGTYQFRTWESSMKDGSLINEDTKNFTVK